LLQSHKDLEDLISLRKGKRISITPVQPALAPDYHTAGEWPSGSA